MFRIPLTFCFLRFLRVFFVHVSSTWVDLKDYLTPILHASVNSRGYLNVDYVFFFSYRSIVLCLLCAVSVKNGKGFFCLFLHLIVCFHRILPVNTVLHIIHTIDVNTPNILCMYDQGEYRNCPITTTPFFIL